MAEAGKLRVYGAAEIAVPIASVFLFSGFVLFFMLVGAVYAMRRPLIGLRTGLVPGFLIWLFSL